jgi:hypothetical protein
MTTLEIIIEELRRQSDADHECSPYLDFSDHREAIIDGRVDLVALAAAIDSKLTSQGG